jgi:CheY-like chemotaxis protein
MSHAHYHPAPGLDPPALVMIVEDETPIAEALSLIVEDAGYRVLVATNGRMAIEQIDAGARPMLIITDLMMPRMDGVALIRVLRANLGAEAPPNIITTAGDRTIASHALADATLPTPFTIRQVEALLHRYLQGHLPPE